MIIYAPDETPIIQIDVDDESYAYRALMRSDSLHLQFSLTQHVEFPVGSYCTFEGTAYELMSLSNVTIVHRRAYEYKLTMSGPWERSENYVVHNPVDRRIVFDLIAKPSEHLALVVANLNEREGANVWAAGTCVDSEEKLITYSQTNCRDAIIAIAETFKTEFEVVGTTISIHKVEYNKSNPLPLSYGFGNGLVSGVSRISSSQPIGRVFVQGGSRNISIDKYGASTLHLPQGATFRFDGEDFVSSGGVEMATDSDGYSVYIPSFAAGTFAESSLDVSEIYPKREGRITAIVFEYKNGFYNSYDALVAAYPSLATDDSEWQRVYIHFCDSTIPESLDYHECLISNNEPLTVIFQSGSLSGREFNVTFHKEAKTKTVDGQTVTLIPANRFEIEHTTIDGTDMPSRNFRPAAGNGTTTGDKYAIFNCVLPDAYINSGIATKQGAEWDALKEAAKFLYERMQPTVSYRGDLDALYAKRNWVNIADRIKCGSFIAFSDPAVQSTAIAVRIVGVKQYVNNKHCPVIEFSNEEISPTKASVIRQLQSGDAHSEELVADSKRYAARSFRNAKETAQMLVDAALDGYSEAINPITVQTMQMLVGDERLQFLFVTSLSNMTPVADPVSYNPDSRILSISASYIKHCTIGIDAITPEGGHATSEYKRWSLPAFTSAVLSDPEKKYYIYAKVSDTAQTGTFLLDETARAIDYASGYYYLLVGILNSEGPEGDRSYAPLYGFTEVLPGQITTDKLRSSDGQTFLDLLAKSFKLGDRLQYNTVASGAGNLLLNGAFVQTGSGEGAEIGAWCGDYDNTRTYKKGDEVAYSVNGTTSTYRYINATASSGHAPTNTSYWKVSAQGVSPVTADLSNEMDSISLDSDGKTTSALSLTTTASMYYGTTRLTLTAVSISGCPTGVTSSYVLSTGVVTFSIASGTTIATNVPITIDVSATYGGTTYTKSLVFSIAGIRAGADGQPVVLYSLLPNVTAVKKAKDGTYSVASISCRKQKQIGNGARDDTNDGVLKYSRDGGMEYDYTEPLEPTDFDSTLTFIYYVNGNMVDRETVPMIIDGLDGDSPIFADLNNEMDSVILTSSGTVPAAVSLTTTFQLWNGTTQILPMTSLLVSGLPTGVTYSPNDNTGVITFSVASGTSLPEHSELSVTGTATIGSVSISRTIVYTLNGIKQGANGDAGISYSLVPSTPVVRRFSNGTYSVQSVHCERKKSIGGNVQNSDDFAYYYSRDGGPEYECTNQMTFDVGSDFTTKITFNWYKSSAKTTLVDTETIYIIADGANGAAGQNGMSFIYDGDWSSSKQYSSTSITTPVVYYNGSFYYVKGTNTVVPQGTYPTNTTYWGSFGGNFESVATKVAYIGKGFIDNAVVRELETITKNPNVDKSSIKAEGKELVMYDESGAMKMRVTGGTLGSSGGSAPADKLMGQRGTSIASVTFTAAEMKDSSSSRDNTYSACSYTSSEITSALNTLTLEAIPITLSANAPTSGKYLVGISVQYRVDGAPTGEKVYGAYTASVGIPPNINITLPQVKVNVLPNTAHVITIVTDIWVDGEEYTGSQGFTFTPVMGGSSGAKYYASVEYADQLVEVASNGFRAMFGSSYLFEAIKTGSLFSSIAFTIRSGTHGLKVTDEAVWFLWSGTWYKVEKSGNSLILTT